jgi:hypothetical protein
MTESHSPPEPEAMTPPSPLSVVDQYLEAVAGREFGRARRLLSDSGFRYVGPIHRFDDASEYVATFSRIGTILERIERRKTFVDGPDVCVVLTFLSSLEPLNNLRIVNWFHVEGGKITSLEVFFDARPYAALFEDSGALG